MSSVMLVFASAVQGRTCAVKIYNRQKIRAQQLEEKVKREIKILKMCDHPHIIRLYEVIEAPTDVYVFIEYSSGGELFDYVIERGRLSESEARRFFQQLISGVEHCHKKMIAHRDLKPENLLLDRDSNVKIADFGLSNFMCDGWFLKTSCGSLNYAAPEVIFGQPYVGPEVDIWSSGVVLYALLCGTLPFDDERTAFLYKNIKDGLYRLPSYLSDGSKDLIGKMLITDPVRRITAEEIRRHPWFRRNLPEYIARGPDPRRGIITVQQDILARVATMMNYAPEKIAEALHKGRRNYLTAGYHLMKDYPASSRGRASSSGNRQSSILNIVGSGTNHGSLAVENAAAGRTKAQLELNVLYPSLRGSSSRGMELTDERQTTREWTAGVQLRQRNPKQAMFEIYRCLRELQWKWKTPQANAFQIRVLVERPEFDPAVRMSLQLYRVASGSYMLDIQRLDGDTLAYFAVAKELLRMLKI